MRIRSEPAHEPVHEPLYETMDQVRKTFRISWYRCPIERETLRSLTKRSNAEGFFQAGVICFSPFVPDT